MQLMVGEGDMRTDLPWKLHPDLTAERLTKVAAFIAQGRSDALDRFDQAVGDDPWTLGCRAYAFSKFRIQEAIDSGEYPWLGSIDPGMQFTFRIGKVPFRFYSGPGDEPNKRTLHQSFPELRQFSLMLQDGFGLPDMLFRFAVEMDFDGALERVIFLGLRGKSIECYWEVPLTSTPAVLHPVDTKRDEGVELPAPTVHLPRKEDDSASGLG